MATLVHFYIEPIDGNVLAFFPQLNYAFNGYRQDNKTCYSHVGQHSACHADYIKELRKANESEYIGLKRELEGIGYNLKVCKNKFNANGKD